MKNAPRCIEGVASIGLLARLHKLEEGLFIRGGVRTMAYQSEQTERFLGAIAAELKKQTARMKFIQLESERKIRRAVLREKALAALAAVQADPGIPELVKDALHAAGEAALTGKDVASAQMIIKRIQKAIQ
jgi:hypothetical protein